MNDMSKTIIPKSDQLNADDLLTGPITIRITGVTVRGGQEQPVSISYEGDNGKPYKACKSMCRVMVSAWGADSSKYVGRSMTLFCDPKVKWGGMEVGGIRISHMSDIGENMTMALTVTRANKKPFTVRPLVADTTTATAQHSPASDPPPAGAAAVATYITEQQEGELIDLLEANGISLKTFLQFGKLTALAKLPAERYEKAKDWISKNRLKQDFKETK